MTFVCFVTLSVNTFLKLFLFFQIPTFPSGDSDRSDKRVQSQKRQGFQTGEKRKLAVTKGGGVGNGQAFVTTGFSELLVCVALVARLSDFCHFCHCHRRESRGVGMPPNRVIRRPIGHRSVHNREMDRGIPVWLDLHVLLGGCEMLDSGPVAVLYSMHLPSLRFHEPQNLAIRKTASFHEAGALSSTVC